MNPNASDANVTTAMHEHGEELVFKEYLHHGDQSTLHLLKRKATDVELLVEWLKAPVSEYQAHKRSWHC